MSPRCRIRIDYAQKALGVARFFYMDSNVKWQMGVNPLDATKGYVAGRLVGPEVRKDLSELCRRHPDVLIFPEIGRLGYFGCCMPYGELRSGAVDAPATARGALIRSAD